jgi:hypothetical protein
LYAWLVYGSERLYKASPKHDTPIVDHDLIDFKASQAQVAAIRKAEQSQKLEKPIIAEVKKYQSTGKIEYKLSAIDLIEMYLNTDDTQAVQDFYGLCEAYARKDGPNPFRTRGIGFSTHSARGAFDNASRYPARDTHGLPTNEAATLPDGANAFCQNCNNPFQKRAVHHKYCSDTCRFEYNRKAGGHEEPHLHGFRAKKKVKN